MAAVAKNPLTLSAEDEARLTAPPPVEDVRFYGSLTPRQALPFLGVSGVTGKAFWIGSLPQPPDEEEETDDETEEEEEEEEEAIDGQAKAGEFEVRLCVPFAPSPAPLAVAIARRAFPRRSRENPPSPRGAPSSSRFVRIWDASLTPSPPLPFPASLPRIGTSRRFARSAGRRPRRCSGCGSRTPSSGSSAARSPGPGATSPSARRRTRASRCLPSPPPRRAPPAARAPAAAAAPPTARARASSPPTRAAPPAARRCRSRCSSTPAP